MPQIEVDFAKAGPRQAFKYLRLYSPHHLVKERIAEVPSFVSPVQSYESQCRVCKAEYTALVYQVGVVTAQHFHADAGVGGIYHHHASGWSVEQQAAAEGLSVYQQSWVAYLDCGRACAPVMSYQFSARSVHVQRIAGVCCECRKVVSEGVAQRVPRREELVVNCYDCVGDDLAQFNFLPNDTVARFDVASGLA